MPRKVQKEGVHYVMKNIPVLMYHSVGIPNPNWQWSFLTCPYSVFESQLKMLKRLGFYTCSMGELYAYMVEGQSLPDRTVALTLDDGYLDNWVFAYPLLKKYGMKATVFVTLDFVDARGITRPYMSAGNGIERLTTDGFLSWDEILTMEREGVVLAESHACTHTWYPCSDTIVDFRHPGDPYIWMTWNSNVDRKPCLQIDNAEHVKLGAPVYEYQMSLSGRRYFPDQRMEQHLVRYVDEHGREAFYRDGNWRNVLLTEATQFGKTKTLTDRYETQEEYEKRIYGELHQAKQVLESKLGREVLCLCWPGGSATETGMKIAQRIGYKLFNVGKDLTEVERGKVRNVYGGGNRVWRYAPVVYCDGEDKVQRKIVYASGLLFIFQAYCRSYRRIMRGIYKVIWTLARFYAKYVH